MRGTRYTNSNRDLAWLTDIGFSPCIDRRNGKEKQIFKMEEEEAYMLLLYDIKRLNFLEDKHVARTGIQPPVVADSDTNRRARWKQEEGS